MEIDAAVPLELENLTDLIQMAIGSKRHEAPSLLVFQHNNEWIFCSITVIPGWMNLKGLPLLVFARTKDEPKGHFIKYDLRASREERIKFIDSPTQVDLTDLPSGLVQLLPIIRLKEPPKFFKIE